MRTISIFRVLAFGCIVLAAKCQDDAIAKVEFTSLTRGYFRQVSISKDSVVEIVNSQADNKVAKRKVSNEEWKTLTGALADISLEEVPELASPTSKRTYDGAKHSTIVISTRDGKSYTHAFDDEDPDKKLQPLMKAINGIVEAKKKATQ